jgi:DNA-binding transcriptional ArsR family regulator
VALPPLEPDGRRESAVWASTAARFEYFISGITIHEMKNDVEGALVALADPTRRRVVELLGEREHRAGELAAAAGTSAPVMSRHLRILLEAGLVADERVPDDARLRVFRLRREPVLALQAWLDQLQAHWNEQLGSFKRHVERKEQQ